MAFGARVFTVFIASPGDVGAEREAVVEELESWNRQHRHSADKIRLEARRWELDAVPEVGRDDVQAVINKQLIDDVDILVAIFHSRLGSATQRDVSGTVEELNRVVEAGKPVHVYFSQKHLPIGHDAGQLSLVLSFQRRFMGYAATFDSTENLRERVRVAVTHDVDLLRQGATDASHDSGFSIDTWQSVSPALEPTQGSISRFGSGQAPGPPIRPPGGNPEERDPPMRRRGERGWSLSTVGKPRSAAWVALLRLTEQEHVLEYQNNDLAVLLMDGKPIARKLLHVRLAESLISDGAVTRTVRIQSNYRGTKWEVHVDDYRVGAFEAR
jgi:hypothetical protein